VGAGSGPELEGDLRPGALAGRGTGPGRRAPRLPAGGGAHRPGRAAQPTRPPPHIAPDRGGGAAGEAGSVAPHEGAPESGWPAAGGSPQGDPGTAQRLEGLIRAAQPVDRMGLALIRFQRYISGRVGRRGPVRSRGSRARGANAYGYPCRGGETGKRTRLKIARAQALAGSSPAPGTARAATVHAAAALGGSGAAARSRTPHTARPHPCNCIAQVDDGSTRTGG
jgi:hypothetical protein